MDRKGLAVVAALLGAGLFSTMKGRKTMEAEVFMAQGRKRAVALRENRVNGGIGDTDPNIVGVSQFAQEWFNRLNEEAEKAKPKDKLGGRYRNLFQEAVNQLPPDEKKTVEVLQANRNQGSYSAFGSSFYPKMASEYTLYLQDKYRGMLKPYNKMMLKHFEKIQTFYDSQDKMWWNQQQVQDELEKIYKIIGNLMNRLPDGMVITIRTPFYGSYGSTRRIVVDADMRVKYSEPFGQGGYATIKNALEIRSYGNNYEYAMRRIKENGNEENWLNVGTIQDQMASAHFASFEIDESEMKAFANWLLDNYPNRYYRILNYNIFFKKNPSIKWVAWDSQKYINKFYDGDISDRNIYQRIKSEKITFAKAFDTALMDKCFSPSAFETNQQQFRQKADALIPKIVSLMSAGEKKEEDLEKQAYAHNRPKIISALNRNFAKYKNPVGAADEYKLQRLTRMIQGERFFPDLRAKGAFKQVIQDGAGEYTLEDSDEMRINASTIAKHKITIDDISFPQSLIDDAKRQIRQKLRDGKESNKRQIESIKRNLKQARERNESFEKRYKGYIDRLNGL